MYDVIVACLGGMGSSAAYHLAGRGKRVLGLERHTLPDRFPIFIWEPEDGNSFYAIPAHDGPSPD
jgi:glycine/D-amino acid oxidase-like deaminating enzyme